MTIQLTDNEMSIFAKSLLTAARTKLLVARDRRRAKTEYSNIFDQAIEIINLYGKLIDNSNEPNELNQALDELYKWFPDFFG